MKKRKLIRRKIKNNAIKLTASLKEIPFQYVLPTFMTLIAFFCGLTSIRFAMDGKFEYAVAGIILAALFDGLDGRVARLLQGTSKFGAEIDSLSDSACFGIAPAFILYLWSMNNIKYFGWVVCLLFAVCIVLRLARFNALLDDEEAKKITRGGKYFMGIPAPAGAILVLFPIIFSFEFDINLGEINSFMISWIIFVSSMVISTIRTLSIKKIKIKISHVLFYLLLAMFLFAGILNKPWFMLSIVCIIYLLSMPIVFIKAKREEKLYK